jgi:PAP2 superfamily
MATLKPVLFVLLMLCLNQSKTFSQTSNNFEYKILKELAEDRTSGKTNFFKTVSKINNPVCLMVPASLFVAGLAEHDKTMRKKALYITETLIGTQAITWIMKTTIKRDRPYISDPTLIPVNYANNKSFPSGHTSEAFSMATSLSIAYPKWYVIAPTFAFASLVGYSRLYLGVHYPSDVFAGAVVGAGCAWLMYRLNKWMHHPKAKTPKEK